MKEIRANTSQGRKEERTPARHDDSYRFDAKMKGPVCCPRCGALYRKGRWTWEAAPPEAAKHNCPACQRIEDNFPAGYITLKGAFFAAHRAEILDLISAREARARAEHPLQRLIGVETLADGVRVTTTDAHLARTLALAVHDSYRGDLDLDFGRDENLLRATWSR